MSRYRNLAGFVLLSAIWGSSFPAIRAALGGVEPLLLAATRFDLVGLLILAVAVARGRRWRPERADLPGLAVGGLFLVGLHNGLLFTGQARVPSAVAAVVMSTVPVLSAGFARLLLPAESLSPAGVGGVFLGLAGTVVIADPEPGALLTADAVGVAFVFGAAAAFALATVLIQRFRTDLPVAAFQGWAMLLGGLALHAWSLGAGEPQTVAGDADAVLGFVFLVVVAGVVGYLLYFGLLDRLGSVEINLVAYVAPAFAALVGWLWLGESLAPRTVVGFGLVFAGFLLVKRAVIGDELARLRSPRF